MKNARSCTKFRPCKLVLNPCDFSHILYTRTRRRLAHRKKIAPIIYLNDAKQSKLFNNRPFRRELHTRLASRRFRKGGVLIMEYAAPVNSAFVETDSWSEVDQSVGKDHSLTYLSGFAAV